MENELSIVVYVDKSASEEDSNFLFSTIQKLPNVNNVTFKSKDEWKLEMSEYSSSYATLLETYDDNPLMDSMVVTVKDVKYLESVTEKIKEMDHVNSASYGEETVDNIISAFDIVQKSTVVVVIALIFVTAFLISNTIKLTIYSRKNEIEIMRLVGASNVSIKLPFVVEGFIIGVMGSLIPVIVTIYGYMIAFNKLGGHVITDVLKLISPFPFVFYVAGIVLIVGALIGMVGSLRAVRKYLKI